MAEDDEKVENEEAADAGDGDAADGAEGEEGEDGEGAEKKGGSKMMLIIIAAAVVLVLGGGAAAYFLLFSGGGEEVVEEEIVEEEANAQAIFYDIPDLTVNLDTGGGASRYLKIKLSLEVGNEEARVALEQLLPRIQDDFQLYLRGLRVEDLQGSAGVYKLKEALLLRGNQAADPVRINGVLIREILIQ